MTTRLVAMALALVTFVLVVLTVPLGVTFARGERSRLAAAVERDATVIAGFAEDALEQGAETDFPSVIDPYQRRTGGRVVIVDASGIAVADSDPPADAVGVGRDFSTRPEFQAALAGDIAIGTRFSETLGEGFLYVTVPVASGPRVHGAVRITYPTAAVESRIRRSWLTLAGVAAVALAAAGLVAVALGRSVVGPLRGVERAASQLGGGDLSARASESSGPPELRRLAATLNTMAARLDELLAAQQSFVADASHQLRTPLTALRLRLEGLALGATGADAAELGAAVDEVVRLNRLVDGLLTLARAESAPPAAGAVDAAAAVRERAAAWQPLAEEEGVELEVRAPDSAPVVVVEGGLEQILDNLMANALRVAPEGTRIVLAVQGRGEHTAVSVIDSGPGMSPERRRHAFDRFWRHDGHAGGDDDGFGLGLAIVARLVAASGGSVSLEEAPGGGLEARLLLRRAGHRAESAAAR